MVSLGKATEQEFLGECYRIFKKAESSSEGEGHREILEVSSSELSENIDTGKENWGPLRPWAGKDKAEKWKVLFAPDDRLG